MIYNSHSKLITILAIVCMLISCSKDENTDNYVYETHDYQTLSKELTLPKVPFSYAVSIPENLFRGTSVNRINVGKDHKATLGRVLFYDTRLSSTNSVSCGSCHQQQFAFADDKALSDGVNHLTTARNSLALAAAPNLSASYDGTISDSAFGWDHSNATSNEQSLAALLNNQEMGNANISEVLNKVNQEPIYQILTKRAYRYEVLEEDQMLESLDAFMNSISTFDTKFDKAIEHDELFSGSGHNSVLTDQENRGKHIYMTHCATCHGVKQDIQQKQIANNGLDMSYADKGVGHLKGKDFNGFFKVPFLRNIPLTAPYMHDGRFNTLDEVIEHYDQNIMPHENLSFELRDHSKLGQAKKLNLSQNDKQALIAFLHTLTDENLLKEEKYSNPFL